MIQKRSGQGKSSEINLLKGKIAETIKKINVVEEAFADSKSSGGTRVVIEVKVLKRFYR